jgi:hypothetical protein
MKRNYSIAIALFIFAGTMVVSSCKKKKDTIAKVFVMDENNNPVTTCRVILKPEPSSVSGSAGKTLIDADTAVTNSAGEAIFNYNELYQLGQAGVAVLNVEAFKDGLTGSSVIQIKEEVTSETTVFIK